jgi:hypothetical protein
MVPESPESEFCIIRGHGENTESVLERLARHVLSSTEALALEEMGLRRYSTQDKLGLFVPIIVTSADLKTSKCEPKNISLSDGTISDPEFETVPWVRFRKSLSTFNGDKSTFTELNKISEKEQRSIFVINSMHLSNFLKQWKLEPSQFGTYPWIAARQIEEMQDRKE